ncbi:hypothetical protein SADUNF_Sadunf18G0092300 [Salix dunnii]|uniref:Uncharacterized protein n=1 Tax=Salix dunnii TaxID=1413687 RepID=A0A835J3G7_9ROSI|nr:hypothetical protein SADUNF_Sadunf18G0092300 [Salix dunnii]
MSPRLFLRIKYVSWLRKTSGTTTFQLVQCTAAIAMSLFVSGFWNDSFVEMTSTQLIGRDANFIVALEAVTFAQSPSPFLLKTGIALFTKFPPISKTNPHADKNLELLGTCTASHVATVVSEFNNALQCSLNPDYELFHAPVAIPSSLLHCRIRFLSVGLRQTVYSYGVLQKSENEAEIRLDSKWGELPGEEHPEPIPVLAGLNSGKWVVKVMSAYEPYTWA